LLLNPVFYSPNIDRAIAGVNALFCDRIPFTFGYGVGHATMTFSTFLNSQYIHAGCRIQKQPGYFADFFWIVKFLRIFR